MSSKRNRRFKSKRFQQGINESKTLINHISCEFKCKFDSRKLT